MPMMGLSGERTWSGGCPTTRLVALVWLIRGLLLARGGWRILYSPGETGSSRLNGLATLRSWMKIRAEGEMCHVKLDR